jgi:4-amino-4-deoxy-L-arabinose transferase-like glycosyltransferase
MRPVESPRIPGGALLVAAATALCLLPFVGKAFHIDDPMYIWPARRILLHPLDPFGFKVNWYGTAAMIGDVARNPPLASYWIALAGLVAGWSERALHLAFLAPAIAATLGTWALAMRLCGRPLAAALAVVSAPVFLVSSSNVMCDTPMLAFWVWSVHFWMEGIRREDSTRLFLAAGLAAAAALTKYFGVALLPLFVAHALFARKRPSLWVAPLVASAALLAGYEAWSAAKYGRGLILDAVASANASNSSAGDPVSGRFGTALAFAGGSFLPALLLSPLAFPRKGVAAALVLAAAAGACFGPSAWIGVQAGLLAAGGAAILLLAADDLRLARDPDSLLLALWVAGTFLFAAVFNWTVSGRALLPLAPPAAILLVRRLERDRGGDGAGGWRVLVPVALSAAVAIWATAADVRWADAQRTAVERVKAISGGREGGTLWYCGHWGFQYYMDAIGGRPIDYGGSELRAGDLVVIPLVNTNVVPFPPRSLAKVALIEVDAGLPVATLDPARSAGFYSSRLGVLPFAFGPASPVRFMVARVVPPGGTSGGAEMLGPPFTRP